MRRPIVSLLAIAMVLGTLLFGVRGFATAQSTDFAGHPLLGVWALTVEDEGMDQVVFTVDGGYIDVDDSGVVVIGAWEPTGEHTANMMFTAFDEDGGYTVRARIEVAADGMSFTAEATFEFNDPETGETSGQYGPTSITGTKVVVEPMGTPIGSVDDLYALFTGGMQATPVP